MNLAMLALKQRDIPRARELLAESVVTQRPLRGPVLAAETLEVCGWLAYEDLRPERAARLFGAASRLRDLTGTRMYAADHDRYDEVVLRAKHSSMPRVGKGVGSRSDDVLRRSAGRGCRDGGRGQRSENITAPTMAGSVATWNWTCCACSSRGRRTRRLRTAGDQPAHGHQPCRQHDEQARARVTYSSRGLGHSPWCCLRQAAQSIAVRHACPLVVYD